MKIDRQKQARAKKVWNSSTQHLENRAFETDSVKTWTDDRKQLYRGDQAGNIDRKWVRQARDPCWSGVE